MEFFQYYRNNQRQPIGLIYAEIDTESNRFSIGWSLCAKNKGDRFDKKIALELAMRRAEKHQEYGLRNLPDKMQDLGHLMLGRIFRAINNKKIREAIKKQQEQQSLTQL